MTMLSLVMPFYMNQSMLQLHFDEWAEWSDLAKAQIEIIIVDDGSPPAYRAAEVPRLKGLPELSIYRVTEDRPWHQHAARNLGAHVAKGPWLLLTDMDHMLTAANADALLRRLRQLDPSHAYMLHRIEADTLEPTMASDGVTLKPHPNSFVMTKELFWIVGGYDEEYCGIYGTDGLFRERLFTIGERDFLKHVALIRYWRGLIPDASTTTLPRKEGRKPGDKQAVAIAKVARGEPDSIITLNFEWEKVL